MAEVQFSNAAEADLRDIDAFSAAEFSDEIAGRYMRGFDDVFARLAEFPMCGRPAADVGRAVRCLTHRQHRVFYRVENRIVLIIRVLHHAMDVSRAFRAEE